MAKKISIVILNDNGELDGQAKAHVQRMISSAVEEAKAELLADLTPQIISKLDAAVFAEYTAADHS
jgi:hypothetical protein